jgi:hypothetical protein
MSRQVDEVALQVLLSDDQIDPATAWVGSEIEEPRKEVTRRGQGFQIGMLIGVIVAVIGWLLIW